MNKMIQDCKEQETVSLPCLVTQCVKGVTNTGAPYLSLTLQDKTGMIEGKLWDVKEDQAKVVAAGRIYEVSAEVLKYRNALQLKVHKLVPVDQQMFDLSEFVSASSIPAELLRQKVSDAVASLVNPVYKKLCEALFQEYDREFYEYPAAAKNHHNFVGGLAEHVVGMLDLANDLCRLYPQLNRDLLISGVLVHDLGKITELSGPVLTEYTLPGKLLGHISIMQGKLAEIAKGQGLEEAEEVTLLRHMVLSHHGEYEYGSPVLPMVQEAEVLHLIDNLDARLNTLAKALSQTEAGSFTARLFPLENRAFYKPLEGKKDAD